MSPKKHIRMCPPFPSLEPIPPLLPGCSFKNASVVLAKDLFVARCRSSRCSKTRLINLDSVTRTDAASDFFGEENVPYQAITMGVETVLKVFQPR